LGGIGSELQAILAPGTGLALLAWVVNFGGKGFAMQIDRMASIGFHVPALGKLNCYYFASSSNHNRCSIGM
jgi:hypothetical protein